MTNIICLICLACLAFIGGMSLTKYVKERRRFKHAKDLVGRCHDCTCGCDTIYVMFNTDSLDDVVIECAKCGRKVFGEDAVEKWNRGERDVEL